MQIKAYLLKVKIIYYTVYITKYNQQDATLQNLFIYFYTMLYMFQAVPPPIIRSSQLYIQHRAFVKPLLLPAAIVEDFQLILDSGR